MSFAYTHAQGEKRVHLGCIGSHLITARPDHVQVRIGKVICCARLIREWITDDRVEMWQLDLKGPIYGRMSAPARNVRMCQGLDGRCTCAPDFKAEAQQHDAAGRGSDTLAACCGASQEGPDGNHGETLPRESEA